MAEERQFEIAPREVVADAASPDAARLRALLDIAKVVGAINKFEDLIELTAEEARRALDASSLSVSRWDRERGVFRILVNVGVLGPDEVRFPSDEVYASADYAASHELLESRRGYVASVDDATSEARLLATLHKDSCLGIPLVVDARVWGAIYATRSAGHRRFTAGDIDFAQAVATQVAAGVVQADHLARIERLAFEDPLTGLANRRAVDERLEMSMAEHVENGTPVSMILADINRLKQVNDSFGHEAGDRLIVAVADAVSRASGLVHASLAARIGGDEFCIVTTGVPAQQAVEVAEELCRIVDNHPLSTGVSCGVASTDTTPGPFQTPLRLFRLADAAQYRAKRSGARTPVVAGNTAPEAPDDAPTDRRARRGRLAVDGLAVLEAGFEVLDRLGGASAQTRLEAVADHVLLLLDGAAWWVSRVRDGATLVSVSSSVQRFAENLDAAGMAQSQIGAQFPLDEFPATRDAIRYASAFVVELGGEHEGDNDPAEEQSLVTAGYTCFFAAGAASAGSGWLLELYGDPISMSFAGFEPVLRSLVTVAVAGGTQPAHDTLPEGVTVPASRKVPVADR